MDGLAPIKWSQDYKPTRKVEYAEIARAIRESVSMDEAVRLYLPSVTPRGKRIPCPIHNGTDYNFSFNSKGYKCFVCGERGDVIEFVRIICGLSSRTDAMKKINVEFNLNLPIEGYETLAFSAEAAERRRQAEERRKAKEAWQERYDALWDEYARLDKIINSLVPNNQEEAEQKSLAIMEITCIEYQLDTLPPEPR